MKHVKVGVTGYCWLAMRRSDQGDRNKVVLGGVIRSDPKTGRAVQCSDGFPLPFSPLTSFPSGPPDGPATNPLLQRHRKIKILLTTNTAAHRPLGLKSNRIE